MHDGRRQARVIHLAMSAGPLIMWAVFAVLRSRGLVMPAPPLVARIMGLVALGILAGAGVAAAVSGSRSAPGPGDDDDEARQRRDLARLVTAWALAEAAAVLAGVSWLLGGGGWTVVVAGGALLMLVVNAPGRQLT